MHIKHIHCMIEGLSEYGKCMIEAGTGNGNVNLCEAGQIVDMIKDLADAEYHSLISKEMKEYKEEEEAEEKYMMKILKEEYKDDYKRMKDEYGEDEGERRFYDNYRYANGRFAPTGRGSYRPGSSGRRRGYEEPMYHMMPDMYNEHDPEYWRDMDRQNGKMYYTDGNMSGNTGGNMGSGNRTGGQSGNMGGDVLGYSEGYRDGNKRGYDEGYSDAAMNAKKFESRYDNVKRNYTETKAAHKGNTQEDNAENMKFLEKVLNFIDGELKELTPGMSAQEKAMTKQKLSAWAQRT